MAAQTMHGTKRPRKHIDIHKESPADYFCKHPTLTAVPV
jgi:hypothetical protein